MLISVLDYQQKMYRNQFNKEVFLTTVKIQATFIDAESGEQLSVVYVGDGSDAEDKGVYKAITGAQKYALMKTFLAVTDDDPEQSNTGVNSNPVQANSHQEKNPQNPKPENYTNSMTPLLASSELIAKQGVTAFRKYWNNLSSKDKALLHEQHARLKALAVKSDLNPVHLVHEGECQ